MATLPAATSIDVVLYKSCCMYCSTEPGGTEPSAVLYTHVVADAGAGSLDRDVTLVDTDEPPHAATANTRTPTSRTGRHGLLAAVLVLGAQNFHMLAPRV